MINVLIADDQAMIRSSLAVLLSAEPDITVVGTVATGVAAVVEASRLAPDVIVMDVRMPLLDGVEATARILGARRGDAPWDGPAGTGWPHGDRPRIIVLTSFHVDAAVHAALRAGACGFLLKDAAARDLVSAIRAAAAGNAWLDPVVTRRLIDTFADRIPPPPRAVPEIQSLTAREREVLTLVAEGLANAEIADRLAVGVGTVKTHVGHILTKLGLRDRAQAIVLAHRHRMVD